MCIYIYIYTYVYIYIYMLYLMTMYLIIFWLYIYMCIFHLFRHFRCSRFCPVFCGFHPALLENWQVVHGGDPRGLRSGRFRWVGRILTGRCPGRGWPRAGDGTNHGKTRGIPVGGFHKEGLPQKIWMVCCGWFISWKIPFKWMVSKASRKHHIRGFPYIEVPKNGWFLLGENPNLKWMRAGVLPLWLGKPPFWGTTKIAWFLRIFPFHHPEVERWRSEYYSQQVQGSPNKVNVRLPTYEIQHLRDPTWSKVGGDGTPNWMPWLFNIIQWHSTQSPLDCCAIEPSSGFNGATASMELWIGLGWNHRTFPVRIELSSPLDHIISGSK